MTAIAAGAAHNIALGSDGTIVTWGDNGYGQTTVPPRIHNDVLAVAAGRYHSLVLRRGNLPTVMALLEEENFFYAQNIFSGPTRFQGDATLSNVAVTGNATFTGDAVGFYGGQVAFGCPTFFNANSEFNGNVNFRLAYPEFESAMFYGDITFANYHSQKINLAGTQLGLGVQPNTFYFRADNTSATDGFAWFKGGAHTNATKNPGPGGRRLMALDDAGLQIEAGLNINAPNNASGLSITGNRPGGISTPLAYMYNANTGASAPALRLVGAGSTPDGVLSVSTIGTGLLARFGNASDFVSHLDYLGYWTATSFFSSSDRNAKQNFEKVEPREVLEKVIALPIQTWTFKNDPNTKHLGPMAQDFYAAFGVGRDEKSICTVDADGVALAAIQGLNELVKEKESKIAALQNQNQMLEKRLTDLEKSVASLFQQTDHK